MTHQTEDNAPAAHTCDLSPLPMSLGWKIKRDGGQLILSESLLFLQLIVYPILVFGVAAFWLFGVIGGARFHWGIGVGVTIWGILGCCLCSLLFDKHNRLPAVLVLDLSEETMRIPRLNVEYTFGSIQKWNVIEQGEDECGNDLFGFHLSVTSYNGESVTYRLWQLQSEVSLWKLIDILARETDSLGKIERRDQSSA